MPVGRITNNQVTNRLDQNWLLYKDPHGVPRNNRTTKMDPTLANLIAKKGIERGYGQRFPIALAGAESTFGRKDSENPLRYLWQRGENPFALADASPEAGKVMTTVRELESQGMPKQELDSMRNYLYEHYVIPAVTINKAFDTLDKKVKVLKRLKKPVTPENLTWLYQGSGTPNAKEIPSRRAYGKPVQVNTPRSPEPVMVRQMMTALNEQNEEGTLGNYLRQHYPARPPSWYRD